MVGWEKDGGCWGGLHDGRENLLASELRFEAQSSGLAAAIVTELINLPRSLFPYL